MKKSIIAGVLATAGVVGFSTSSQAQGHIYFNTYAATPYYAIVYNPTSALGGQQVGANVSAELGYKFGTMSSFTLLPGSITSVNATASQGALNGSGPVVTGWITGGIQDIPGYSSGPIQFEILAWVASGTGAGGGTYDTSGYSGSLSWTEPSIASGTSPAGYFTAMPGELTLNAAAVPEPSTLALAGLGGFGMLMALRRKKA